ncbi:MAG: methylated-DNA--[protein]-cysteine S-methyltransferase [Alphaproteobacteria bacterium]|nr:methylated-DNA--[protein]-cysteine S-methyltransferase [Alphaproteobacteria bacterium]
MTERYISEVASPIGTIAMVIDGGALEVLDFRDDNGRFDALVRRLCPAGVRRSASDPSGITDRIAAYFEGELGAICDIETRPSGTAFQQSVWQALRSIPCGSTIAYRELANRVGNPRANQAVGQANGRNPVAIVLPCHRVIGADGSLTGYGGGLERKAWLLRHEGAIDQHRDA